MKRLFSFLFIFIFLIILGIITLPYILSSNEVWQQVNPILEAQLGRKITVNGQKKIELYPDLLLKLSDVTIDDNESESHLVKLQELNVGVELIPLISGKINIKQLILSGASINLRKDADGVANWQNADAIAPLPAAADDPLGQLIEKSVIKPSVNDQTNDNIHTEATAFDIANLNIKNFKIINSQLSYIDVQQSVQQNIDGINVDIKLLNNNQSLNVIGNLVWMDEKLDIMLEKLNLLALLEAQKTPLDLSVKGRNIQFKMDSNVHLADKINMQGHILAQSPDIAKTAKWLKQDIGNLKNSALEFNSNFKISGTTYQLAALSLNAFGSAINGTLNISLADNPNIYGKLDIDRFNIDNVIKGSKKQTAVNGWSKEKIDLGILSKLNSNIALKIGRLNMADIQANHVNTSIIIRKSTLKMPLKLQIFDGQSNSQINAKLSNSSINFNNQINLKNINIGKALKALKIDDTLEGSGNATINITSRGTSLSSIMQNLNGKGHIVLNNGVIKGIAMADALAPELANIDLSINSPKKLLNFAAKSGKNVFQQNMSGMMAGGFNNNVGAEKQTKFVKAEMHFKITKGVLSNDDLKINSSNIFIHGAGDVNLFKQSLNYRIIPKILRKTKQGNSERMTIPVIITGKWAAPIIKVDYAYAIENSQTLSNMRDKLADKITQQITNKVTDKIVNKVTQKIGNKLGDKVGDQINSELGNQIGNLLGKKSNKSADELPTDNSNDNQEINVDTGKLLNSLFN